MFKHSLRGSLAVVTILLAGVLTSSIVTVSGEPVVIDFEDLSTSGPGQGEQVEVSTQYSRSKGITFNSPVALDYSKGLAIPGFAHSGTKAVEQCYAKEFCTTPIKMSFTRAQSRVKVWVGYSAGMDETRTVYLIAYDKDDNYVGKAKETLDLQGEPLPIRIPLEVSSESANIMYAEVTFSLSNILSRRPIMNHLAVDDVEFEAAEPPRLSVSPDPPSFSFEMNAGETDSRDFTISNAGGGTLTWEAGTDQRWISVNPQSGTNSGTVTIDIDTAGLNPGNYKGTITVSSNGGNKEGRISLNMPTPEPAAPLLSVSPDPPSFSFEMNAGETDSRDFTISNAGGGTLTWEAGTDQRWISVSPQSGTNSGTVTIDIDTAGLNPGNYKGTITVSSNGGNKEGRISLNMPTPEPAAPLLSVSPDPPSFSFEMNAGETDSRDFTISNAGGGTLTWEAGTDQRWISVNPQSGTNLGTVTIDIDTAGLSPGSHHSGTITISSNGGNKQGRITLNIPPPEPTPLLSVSPDPPSYSFDMNVDETTSREFSISNAGGGTLTWEAGTDQRWISVYPQSGTNSGTVTIDINTAGLSPGSHHSGTITVTSNGGNKQGRITLNIPPPEPTPIEIWVPLILAGVIALGGVTFTICRIINIRHRKYWQEGAEEEEELPETCQSCTRHCRKIELELEPALRKIAYLSLVAFTSEERKERLVKGEVVDGLNRVVRAHHRREEPEKLQSQVVPQAQELLQQIMEWLHSEPAPRDISVVGHLEGGKVACQFILYHCKHRGAVNVWEEEAKWKATINDERDEPVGTLRSLDPSEPRILERLTPELTQLLMQFIEKV